MRIKKGTVISDKMDKTLVMEVHTYKSHPIYKKKYRISRKFMANDPENKYKIGDTITICETRPLSKNKRWTVIEPKAKEETNQLQS